MKKYLFVIITIVFFGCSESEHEKEIDLLNEKPNAEFCCNQSEVEVNRTVNFTDESTGEPTSWTWTFGDGGSSTQQNPTYIYNAEGNYTVSLTASNEAGENTETKDGFIKVNALYVSKPEADFSCNQREIEINETISFTDKSTNDPDSWSWDFGDGGTSTEQSPSHVYQTEGNYSVSLTAINAGGSDIETKNEYITVKTIVVSETGTVTDIDGNIYKTVKIGEQWWMAENLKVTHYSDGTPIKDGTGHGSITYENEPAYWFSWGDNLDNVNAYGRLYTYYVVISDKNVCPSGWHMSTDEEWQTLTNYVYNNGYAGQEGNALKADYGWIMGKGVDAFGFEGLPGGFRQYLGYSDKKSYKGYFWTNTGFDNLTAWSYVLRYDTPTVLRNNDVKKLAFSIRCVRNENN